MLPLLALVALVLHAGCVTYVGRMGKLYGDFYSQEISNRLFDGKFVNISEYPSVVFLSVTKKNPDDVQKCLGAVISDQWILTIASCVKSCTAGNITIRAGSSYFHKDYKTYNVSRLLQKEAIAAIQVDGRLDTDCKTIEPVKNLIKRGTEIAAGEKVVLLGFGDRASSDDKTTEVLHQTESQVMCSCDCKPLIKDVASYHFCTYEPNQIHGIDDLDTGGPVYIDDFLVGVVDGGWKNKTKITPNKIVKISYYRDWIKNQTGI